MKISDIKVTITEKDLFSIIRDVFNDYVKVEGLSFEKILIDKNIELYGTYKNKINIPFSLIISIKEVKDNILTLGIEKVNIKNHKVFGGLINIVLKTIGGKVKDLGIVFEDNLVKVHFSQLCEVIPMVYFEMQGLEVIPYGLQAELKNFNFDGTEKSAEAKEDKTPKDKEEKPEVKSEEKQEKEEGKSSANINHSEVKEGKEYTYRKFREELKGRFNAKYKKIYPYVVMLPDIIALMTRLYKDPRVTKETKANISIALGYLLLPFDIIPDSIPLVGKLDDVAVIFFVIQKIFCDIPTEVIVDNWEGEGDVIEVVSGAVNFFGDKFGTGEIKKVVDLIRISTKKAVKFFVD